MMAPTSSGSGDDDSMEETYDWLAKRAMEQYTQQRATDPQGRLWIALAGAPGSGKTTVGEAVVDRINQYSYEQQQKASEQNEMPAVEAICIPMDGYHYSQAEMKQKGLDMKRRGAPWTLDAEQMCRDLKRAHHATFENDETNTVAELPDYDRTISDPRPKGIQLLSHHKIVIVEGLYVLLGLLLDDLEHSNNKSKEKYELLRKAISMIPEWNNDEQGGTTNVAEARAELQRWKPLLDLWDETWFVAPPIPQFDISDAAQQQDTDDSRQLAALLNAFSENKRRLVERSLQTWTDEKTKLWGPGGTARDAAANRVDYNDVKNGVLISCCRLYTQVGITTQ